MLKDEEKELLEQVISFYGHASPQARVIARIMRQLQTVNVEDVYEKFCPTCRCPACGRTRAQAAAVARDKQARGKRKYEEGKFISRSTVSDNVDDLDDYNDTSYRVGFSVADIEKAKELGVLYQTSVEKY